MSDYLCEELIFEIFTRLPPKSLLRFRSLSKWLYTCISSPSFVRMHTFRSPQKLLIRNLRCFKKIEFKDSYILHSEDRLTLCSRRGSRYSYIIGSCNGILCMLNKEENCISIWNPSIMRQLVVPDLPHRCSSFDEVVSGFGFDPIINDYKIVSISYLYPKETREIPKSSFVYTMKTGTWCAISSPIPLFCDAYSKACFVSGALHWVVTNFDDIPCNILTFDLATHVFGMIALPNLEPRSEILELTTMQGFLVVVCLLYDESCLIWERRDASWSVIYKSTTNQVSGGLRGVLQLSSNGDLVFRPHCELFQVYTLKVEELSKLVDFKDDSCVIDIVPCVESLELLDMGTACEGSPLSFLERKMAN